MLEESLKLKPYQLIHKIQTDQNFVKSRFAEFAAWTAGSINGDWKKGFHEILPTEKINKWLAIETPKITACFDQGEILGVEMVGSTSIPGMAGMLAPDFEVIVKSVPPTEETLLKLEDLGYRIMGFSPFDTTGSLWMLKRYEYWQQENVHINAKIHISKKGSPSTQKLIAFRELAIKDKTVFNDYRNKKIQMMNKEKVEDKDFLMYKMEKGKVVQKHLGGPELIPKWLPPK